MTPKIFISGAGSGLGFSLAARFLCAGWRIFAGEYQAGSDLSELCKKFPAMLTIIPLDVSRMASIRAAAKQVAKQAPALDVLINNAGIHIDHDSTTLETLDFSDHHLEKTMTVNAFGPLRMVQQFHPLLAAGGRKLIVNISSEAGSIGDCGRGGEFAYCMSKSALNMQSKILQNHLGPQGFKVLALHPGWMRTGMGGPDAAISPDESADGIFTLVNRNWSPDDEIYLDYLGRALRW